MGRREPLQDSASMAGGGDRRLERLIDLERLQVSALAAHVRYVQSVLLASGGVPPKWLDEMAARLDEQAGRLEALGIQVREVPPQRRRDSSSHDEDLDLLFARARGPLGTLAEEFNLRAAGLGCALDEADELDDGRVTTILREHLRQLEVDLEALRKRLGR